MDPRFRQRWVEVRRMEGRRRFRVVAGIGVIGALGVGGWAATGSALLDLDRIVVVGAVHTPADEARFASGLRRGERLLDVDGHRARRAVETLPWVEEASISKRWPGEIRIRLVERRPVAFTISQAGNAAVVDGTGRVLEWADVPPPGLGALTGLPPAGPAGSRLAPEGVAALAVAAALPNELRARSEGVLPADGGRGEVNIRISPEGVIRLGPPDDLQRKFDAVRAVLAQVDLHSLAVLDVRRPESPVLTRREPPAKVSTPRAG